MIKNPDILKTLEKNMIRSEKIDIQKNFRIFEAMYTEAVALGVFPLKDPLEGIEIDIKIAKAVNSVSTDPFKHSPSAE